jgi:ATP-binding cassette, subfamily B, bacterial
MIGFIQSWQNAKISMDRLNEIHTIEDEEPAHKNLLRELPFAFQRQLVGGKSGSSSKSLRQSAEDFSSAQGQLAEEDNYYAISSNFKDDNLNVVFKNSEGCVEMASSLGGSRMGAWIGLHSLSFTYPGAGNEPVLQNINLQIPKGKTTAIVGTRATPLEHISHKTWRSHCGVVMQESFIFSDTIAKNIAVGTDKVDMNKLVHAVTVANCKDFIESLPLGFNTKIGAEGNGISMGQKQRILIARAVYRDPDFIFFDEATNSLDANNESVILENLNSFFKGRTVIIVAHRLSTVKHADQIVVLNKGVISEKGTHQELVNLKGEYYTLVKNQLEIGE